MSDAYEQNGEIAAEDHWGMSDAYEQNGEIAAEDHIGAYLREKREAGKLERPAVAGAMGVSRQAVAQYEENPQPGIGVILRYVRALRFLGAMAPGETLKLRV